MENIEKYNMKRVLITGATAGIGKAVAEKYKKEGYYVIGMGSRKEPICYLDEYISCDFSSDEIFSVLSSINEIDVLINNAGINKISNFCDIKFEEFNEIHKVNLFAPFILSQHCIPYMMGNRWGRIVNVCSIWSKISKIGRASYSSSKFALEGMSIAMAHEFSKHNILVNCISPGFVDTDMTRKNLGSNIGEIINQVPIGRLCHPEEIANSVYWLGSDNNTFISGQNVVIDGGFSVG